LVDSTTQERPLAPTEPRAAEPPTYDRRRLTYSNTFDSAWKRTTIRAIEWVTGKIAIMRMLREYQRGKLPTRANFWHRVFEIMRIDIVTPREQIARIPATGPVVIVANHPHGLVDGMAIADLVSNVRLDFKILSRGILTGIDETAASFMISVPFQHEEDAQRKGIEMRAAAMARLEAGGVIIVFPSGVVASSETMFGPAVEAEWNVFTAKMIRRSGATIVPIYFPGANSRLYQIANRISATLRQSLLLHEIVAACGKIQSPVIGKPIAPEDWRDPINDPRAFMAWLRDHTLSLGKRTD
jgi:putative hemolysin